MTECLTIPLRGVRVHNLQSIDVDVPLGKLTVVTGVSGAGKSSLVFDTLYAEAQRRYLQGFSPYIRQFLERFDKPDAEFIGDLPPAIAVSQRNISRNPLTTVGTLTEIIDYLGVLFARRGVTICDQCGQTVKAHGPSDVVAAVATLPQGSPVSIAFPSKPDSDGDMSDWAAELQSQGFVRAQVGNAVVHLGKQDLPSVGPQEKLWVLVDRLEAGKSTSQRLQDSIETSFARGHGRLALLTNQGEILFDRRLVCPRCDIPYSEPQARLFRFNGPLGACATCHGTGLEPKSDGLCAACHGGRFNVQALSVRLDGHTIAELCHGSLEELDGFVKKLSRLYVGADSGSHADDGVVLDQLRRRLEFLIAVELGYLSLDRAASALSTGEARRVRLTTALASTMVQALFLFEEPTAGLHPRDIGKVLDQLRALRDAGNTVILVEHSLEVVRAADYVIDLGPGAGEEGGRQLYQGSPEGLAGCAESVTAEFLRGEDTIPVPVRRRSLTHGRLSLSGANAHNLRNLTVDFPLGVLCVVTGISGAGKSSLVEDSLYPALMRSKNKKAKGETGSACEIMGASQVADVLLMNQEPLPRSSRSNPATYLKIFDDIREVFADTSEARIHNFGPGAFSFNQPGGRCEVCEGQGVQTVDMRFLADVTMTCPECQGARFKREILNVKVRSLSIAEVLDLTVREAFRFFRAQRKIEQRLKFLLDVGLDYLRLGQPMDTLSGGECQRLKLAGHIASSRKPRCLFILLEPTNGLHLADVQQLLACFQRLLESGHSLLVVEHHLDIIKCADYVIDLGPGAGQAGGRLVATGTPEEIAQVEESHTGQCLRKVLVIQGTGVRSEE
jgi:excinuclease ABC subunit A